MADENEDDALRSVALQNAQAILLARQRAEQELIQFAPTAARSEFRPANEITTSSCLWRIPGQVFHKNICQKSSIDSGGRRAQNKREAVWFYP